MPRNRSAGSSCAADGDREHVERDQEAEQAEHDRRDAPQVDSPARHGERDQHRPSTASVGAGSKRTTASSRKPSPTASS